MTQTKGHPHESATFGTMGNCRCEWGEAGHRPMPGDAVRLTREWFIAKPGAIGIIGGIIGRPNDDLHITFNCRGSAFRGPSSAYSKDGVEHISCSGGPATIGTPHVCLRPTQERIRFEFWKWKDLPRAGGGVPYELEVPVWEWDGSELLCANCSTTPVHMGPSRSATVCFPCWSQGACCAFADFRPGPTRLGLP